MDIFVWLPEYGLIMNGQSIFFHNLLLICIANVRNVLCCFVHSLRNLIFKSYFTVLVYKLLTFTLSLLSSTIFFNIIFSRHILYINISFLIHCIRLVCALACKLGYIQIQIHPLSSRKVSLNYYTCISSSFSSFLVFHHYIIYIFSSSLCIGP